MIRAPDKMIARRADTQARADVATWKMMSKLNGVSTLPAEARRFLLRYNNFLTSMGETEATEATIALVYKSYYARMGGAGKPPELRPGPDEPVMDNVTEFRRPQVKRPRPAATGSRTKPRLPVALIFACIAVVYVGIRYFWR